MAYIIGRGVRVELGVTEGAPISVSAVSATKPPVATAAAHGLAAKSLGYFSVAPGIPELVGQACRLNPVTAGNFTLEDLDGTAYQTLSSAGSFIPVTAWQTLGNTVDYDVPSNAANPLPVTVILDEIEQEENGLLGAQSVAFNLRAQTISDTAMSYLRSAARKNNFVMFRITLKDGNVRFFRGQPSLPGESVGQGAVGSQSCTVRLKGFYCEGAA